MEPYPNFPSKSMTGHWSWLSSSGKLCKASTDAIEHSEIRAYFKFMSSKLAGSRSLIRAPRDLGEPTIQAAKVLQDYFIQKMYTAPFDPTGTTPNGFRDQLSTAAFLVAICGNTFSLPGQKVIYDSFDLADFELQHLRIATFGFRKSALTEGLVDYIREKPYLLDDLVKSRRRQPNTTPASNSAIFLNVPYSDLENLVTHYVRNKIIPICEKMITKDAIVGVPNNTLKSLFGGAPIRQLS